MTRKFESGASGLCMVHYPEKVNLQSRQRKRLPWWDRKRAGRNGGGCVLFDQKDSPLHLAVIWHVRPIDLVVLLPTAFTSYSAEWRWKFIFLKYVWFLFWHFFHLVDGVIPDRIWPGPVRAARVGMTARSKLHGQKKDAASSWGHLSGRQLLFPTRNLIMRSRFASQKMRPQWL